MITCPRYSWRQSLSSDLVSIFVVAELAGCLMPVDLILRVRMAEIVAGIVAEILIVVWVELVELRWEISELE